MSEFITKRSYSLLFLAYVRTKYEATEISANVYLSYL